MQMLKSIFLCLILAHPAFGAEPDGLEALADGGIFKVVAVVDGDTVILNNKRQVRMVGIQAPKLPLGRPNFKPWPLAKEAKAHLQTQILGQQVQLRLGATPQDRHGRLLAHLVRVSDGLWLQGDLLRVGLARVYTFPDNRRLAAEMLARERQARADGVGMWALPHYALRNGDNVGPDVSTFQVVEDRVVNVAKVRKRIYLNFGADWRTDFTVQINTKNEKLFIAQGMDVLKLKGMRIRVRGWIKDKNGPMIVLDHPERLELILR